MEQIKGYELNYSSLQEENEKITEKLANSEKLCLKLKAKLKQFIQAKQQNPQVPKESLLLVTTSNLNEEIRPSTPSPALNQSNFTQTDPEDLEEKLKSTQEQNLKLKAKLKQLLSSNKNENSKSNFEDEKSKLAMEYESKIGQLKLEMVKLTEALQSDQDTMVNQFRSEISNVKKQKEDLELKMENLILEENKNKENIRIEFEARINELSSEILSLKKQKEHLEIKISENENIRIDFESRIDQLTKEKEDLEFRISEELKNKENIQIDFETRIEKLKEEIKRKESEVESVYKKLNEFDGLIELKDKMNESLMNQTNELKQLVEQHRIQYENQLNNLTLTLNQKESSLIEVNNELTNLRTQTSCLTISTNTPMANSACASPRAGSTVSSSTNLESQLKYCHEKCENVVQKLTQLKKQNESLNSKIKSIKSMIYT